MAATTTVRLTFEDVLGKPLDDHTVIVDIFDLHDIDHYQVTVPMTGETAVAISLADCPGGVYRFELSPTNYQIIQFFLTLPPPGGVCVRKDPVVFPVDPNRVVDISAPGFNQLDARLQDLLNSSSVRLNSTQPAQNGQFLYDSLPPKLKACLLNLFLKSSNTKLLDKQTCFDHIDSLIEIDQDRFFAKTDSALVEEAANSSDFHAADFSLHKEIPPYRLFSSFKSLDGEGNLQLTFSRNGNTGNDYLVDMDIDEAQGIKHVFEVIHNVFAGLTNPYNVREILMAAQRLRPLYTFQFAQRKVATLVKPAKVAKAKGKAATR